MDNIAAGAKQGFRVFDSKSKAFKGYGKKQPNNLPYHDYYVDSKGLIVTSSPPYPCFDPKNRNKPIKSNAIAVIEKSLFSFMGEIKKQLQQAKGNVSAKDLKKSKRKKKGKQSGDELPLLFHIQFVCEPSKELTQIIGNPGNQWNSVGGWNNIAKDKKRPALKMLQARSKATFKQSGLQFTLWRISWRPGEKLKKNFMCVEYFLSPRTSANDKPEDWVKRCTFMQNL